MNPMNVTIFWVKTISIHNNIKTSLYKSGTTHLDLNDDFECLESCVEIYKHMVASKHVK